MAAQTISLKSAFAEAERIGLIGGRFKEELIMSARAHFMPASAGYWTKALLDFRAGDTLADALNGTSLSPMIGILEQRENTLRAQGVSYHRCFDHYHTLVFASGRWYVYFVKEYEPPFQRWNIFQSYWDMDVYIDNIYWQVVFENRANYTRFEASQIDFDLGPMKEVWKELGPALKASVGRRAVLSTPQMKERARSWARQNYPSATTAAFRDFVQSLFPDRDVSKTTMDRVFIPIWREEGGGK